MKGSVVFDIGKTNKKCFVFDEDYQIVHQEILDIAEIRDEDGDPADNLAALVDWIRDTLDQLSDKLKFGIGAVNFSTYGASFVHLDQQGKPVAPLYNYLKPYPQAVRQSFYEQYGPAQKLAKETASPALDMLNSGLQLYWLKQTKPEIFAQIRWSLHLPQYLSYCLTGIPVSEFTSVGCHTALWNYAAHNYHDWVYEEGLEWQLPPLVPTSLSVRLAGKPFVIGPGIHDSSAALIPYLRAEKKPFVLLSTGTWNICMNPFAEQALTQRDLNQDCLHFMQPSGQPVRASRLFLGHEFARQVQLLEQHFDTDGKQFRKQRFAPDIYHRLLQENKVYFNLENLPWRRKQPTENQIHAFSDYPTAYHQLMLELTEVQERSLRLAIGRSEISKVYLDGGFAENDVFVTMLALQLPEYKVRTTRAPVGSALGAAMVLSDQPLTKKFLKKRYSMQKYRLRDISIQNE
ncbi:MAG: carbohydrate kinase [Lewinellaceae bacterium]|nr:carbohydrate kinase [Lewinellaceae bacterium]